MSSCSAPMQPPVFRFWGSATSGRLEQSSGPPQLKVNRLCSVVDGTADFDPEETIRPHPREDRGEPTFDRSIYALWAADASLVLPSRWHGALAAGAGIVGGFFSAVSVPAAIADCRLPDAPTPCRASYVLWDTHHA